jgi:hypothetical protein
LSKSKSKTPQTSKNSRSKPSAPPSSEVRAEVPGVKNSSADLAVGHNPRGMLSPQDASLFKAFQSNLLSLISHELRTPLMGIINSLTLFDDDTAAIPKEELLKIARKNSERLNSVLSALLDLAAIESGTFHARLREIDFSKTIRNRVGAAHPMIREHGVQIKWSEVTAPPILADAQQVGRATDLCLQAILPRVAPGSTLEIRMTPAQVEFWFPMREDARAMWEESWAEAQAGVEGGVSSTVSAFTGVMQSEEAFLTRQEEGLGSEFILIHEIMRIHQGEFRESRDLKRCALILKFPEVSSEEGVRAVLTSRAYDVSTELKSVALILINVPKKTDVDSFSKLLKSNLFRSSDAVYPLYERRQTGLVLDDCKAEDVPHLVSRLKREIGKEYPNLRFSFAHCPGDELDPSKIFDLAEERLKG